MQQSWRYADQKSNIHGINWTPDQAYTWVFVLAVKQPGCAEPMAACTALAGADLQPAAVGGPRLCPACGAWIAAFCIVV